LLRKHDSPAFPYTKASELTKAFDSFCEGLAERISQLPQDPKASIEWAKQTAAWIEYRINLADHFYEDGCAKVAAVLVAFVCALADSPMPVFLDRADYFKDAANTNKEWAYYYSYRFPEETKAIVSKSLKPIAYYVKEATQNLENISGLIREGKLSTDAYASKKATIKAYDPTLLSSKVEADFNQELKRLYSVCQEKRKQALSFATTFELCDFVRTVACNLLKNNIKITYPDDIFREAAEGDDKNEIRRNFLSFMVELNDLLKALKEGKKSASYVCVAIHYRLAMTGKFFKDGNKRVALALETFVMMSQHNALPAFCNKHDWRIAAPQPLKDEEKVPYGSDLSLDARFLKWYYKHNQLFGANPGYEVDVDLTKQQPTHAWEVPTEGALARALELQHTIYAKQHILQELTLLQAYVQKTGIAAKKMAVFMPERTLLQEAIAEVLTKVALPVGNEAGKLKELVNDIIDTVKANPSFKVLATIGIGDRFESFKKIAKRKLERNAGSAQQTDQYAQLISQYSGLIRKHYASSNKRMKLAEEQETIADLVAWELLRKEYQTDIETMVSEALLKLEEENKCNFLTMRSGFERALWMLAGGPASGKRSISNGKGICSNKNGVKNLFSGFPPSWE
jgi:hypothetical protein